MHHRIHQPIVMLILFVGFGLVGCNNVPPTSEASPSPRAVEAITLSPTLTPTSTISIKPTITPSTTPSATQSSTNTITPTPTITPFPFPSQTISPGNASQVVQLSVWGKGFASKLHLGNQGQVLIVDSPLGIYLYQADNFDFINFIDGGGQFHLSPDQKTMAVIKAEGLIKLWDVRDGTELHSLEHTFTDDPPADEELFLFEELGIGRRVNHIIFTPDSQFLIAGYGDKTIDVWQISDGSLVKEFSDPIGQSIQRIALSPDNRYLVTSGQAVGLWDFENGELLKLIPNAGRISDSPFSVESDILITTDMGTVLAWSLPEMSVVNKFGIGIEYANVKFSEDGEFVIINNGEQIRRFSDGKMANQEQIETLSVELATPQPTPAWNFEDLIPLNHFVRPQDMILTADQSIFVSGVQEKTLFEWNVLEGEISQKELVDNPINRLVISPDGRFTAVCSKTVLEIQLADNTLKNTYDRCKETGNLAISQDSQTIYRASGTVVDVIQTADGSIPHQLRGHQLEVSALTLSPDGKLLASGTAVGSGGAELIIWERDPYIPQTRINVSSACGYYCSIENIAISPDNSLAATGGADQYVKLWRISDGWLLTNLDPGSYSTSLTFSSDGELLVGGDWSGKINIWNILDGELLNTLEGHAGPIIDLLFSEDGASLFSLSSDGTVRLWGIEQTDL